MEKDHYASEKYSIFNKESLRKKSVVWSLVISVAIAKCPNDTFVLNDKWLDMNIVCITPTVILYVKYGYIME